MDMTLVNELFSKSLTETVYDSGSRNHFTSLRKIYKILCDVGYDDMTREQFLEWRLVWRQAYREITRTSRMLKLHRKETFLKKNYEMAENRYGSVAFLRAWDVRVLKDLATLMLMLRQHVKDDYREHLRTVHSHED